jgi:cell division protein ZapA (FtsZ GTPase activity inhibitor)
LTGALPILVNDLLFCKKMSELIPVNILIGDRQYRIRINPGDEEQVRKTLKTINDKIIEFRTQFAGKDMQDYIAMVLAWFATQSPAENAAAALSKDTAAILAKMEQQIDGVL